MINLVNGAIEASQLQIPNRRTFYVGDLVLALTEEQMVELHKVLEEELYDKTYLQLEDENLELQIKLDLAREEITAANDYQNYRD